MKEQAHFPLYYDYVQLVILDCEVTENKLGSDQRINVHVNAPSDGIRRNVNVAAERKFAPAPDNTFREFRKDSLVHTSSCGL